MRPSPWAIPERLEFVVMRVANWNEIWVCHLVNLGDNEEIEVSLYEET